MGHQSNREKRWDNERREATVTRKKDEGVPALKNEDVTGMTEEKQEKVVRQSGRAARKDAAEEFYEELGEQARRTPASKRQSE
jgi:hypothetical protein